MAARASDKAAASDKSATPDKAATSFAKPAVVAAAEPRREKPGAIPVAQPKPAKAESYQVASAGSVPVKPAGFEMASASSTPVAVDNVRVAQVSSPAAASAKSDTAQTALAPAPVRPAQAASLVSRADVSAMEVINERGYWQGPPADVAEAQTTVARTTPPLARRAAPDKVAAANIAPWTQTNRPSVGALSYAGAPSSAATRPTPAGTGNARAALGTPDVAAKPLDEPTADTPRKGPDTVQVGDRFNDPWVRAMMLSPSAHVFLRTTLYGSPDYRDLGAMFAKPSSALVVKFTQNPTNGLSTERFTGGAVAFTPTMNFVPRTAALR